MKMFVKGAWCDAPETIEVRNPFDQSLVDTVPRARAEHVDAALSGAVEGAEIMRRMPAYDRAGILRKAADLMVERVDDLARTISMEEGKILAEARIEAERASETMQLSAEESKRLTGEVLPLDAAPGGAGRIGFTLRVPCGVVVAITPFNFPLNLVCHKVGPALAAGNAVVIKPATDTPLSALKLVEILLEVGLPPLAVACLTGPGSEVGEPLSADRRVRKISFTGSYDVGDRICRAAGMKKVTMELGSNSPLIIMDDADLDQVVEATAATGYANAGQVCISAQRLLTADGVHDELLGRLKSRVETITVGDQLGQQNQMGPMVREADAVRVHDWIQEAVSAGATLVTGGERQGAMVQPAVIANADSQMRICRDELFGPAVAVSRFGDIDQAIAMANDSRYGLSAGIFTRDLDWAMKFAREVYSGNLQVNWGPQWRADLIPYGGVKDSGMGKEGPKYAVQEMSELKTVILHLKG